MEQAKIIDRLETYHLLKIKQMYLKHAITSMASHFFLANTLMSAALVAASYMNIALIKCQQVIMVC